MNEHAPRAPDLRTILQNLVSLLEVTDEPLKATLWFVTSPREHQRHALVTKSGMYELPLLHQLHDTLEEAREALGATK